MGMRSMIRSGWQTPVILSAFLVAVALLLYWLAPSGLARIWTEILMRVVLVVGLYIFIGNSGIVSFGQTAFSTIGAYATAWLTVNPFIKGSSMPGLPGFILHANLPPILAGSISIAFTTAIAALIAMLLSRLRGEAATIATFALLVIVNATYSNWGPVTGGTSTIVGVPLVVGMWSALAAAVLAIFVAYAFQASNRGLMLRASRDDQVASEASGVNVRAGRILAFTLSGAFMALGGILQAHYLGTLSVNDFYLATTFMILAMLVVGGRGSLTGAVLGAVLISILIAGLRLLERGVTVGGTSFALPGGLQELLIGLAMLAMLIRRKRGITGTWEIGFPSIGRRAQGLSTPPA